MKFLRSLLLRNVGLKALSLLLALLLWMQISGQETVQGIISVPIVFVNMPSGLEITGDYQTAVDVVIRSERAVRPVQESGMTVIVDLGAAGPGEQVIPLTERDVANVPVGVEVVNLMTSRIRLRLERVQRKTVEIRPQLTGEPAKGFEVVAVSVTPGMATIVGPERRMANLQSIPTEALSVEGASSSFVRQAYLDLPAPVRIENLQNVTVRVVIQPERVSEE